MKTAVGRAANPVKPEDLKKSETRMDPDGLSFKQIEERASAKTEVLNAILAKEERSSWRHWGLNE